MKYLKHSSLLIFALIVSFQFYACSSVKTTTEPVSATQTESDSLTSKPKLVVGIIVDQMRYDYLTRFWDRYGDDGFKRLINEGYNLKNTHYNYMPTYTAPGHTSVYTGTTPRYHGIIGNAFYDKELGKSIVPVENDSVEPVGTTSDAGKRSPKYLLASTIGDQNRLATQFEGKTIGVSLKDRGAILPAGRGANAAYWFSGDKEEGKFISSTYYMDNLPKWVENFNASGKVDEYLTTWNTLYPIETYTESGPDSTNYEGNLNGVSTFPYDLKKLKEEKYGYELLFTTPFGNALTTDFALATIDGEDLGKDDITDVLAISYSSTDYVGHRYGVNSKEAQDTYLRLDKEIARLLKNLDEKVGKGNYTLFLTADHAGGHVPKYLQSKKIAAGYFSTKELRKDLKAYTKKEYNTDDLIASVSNYQVFFNYDKLKENGIDRVKFEREIQNYLMQYSKVAQAYTRTMLESSSFDGMISSRVKKGFNPKRSGDVAYVLEPAVISYPQYGSTHGSPYSYDTHVPLLFYGNGIKHGESVNLIDITDIAPTISALLDISFPNAAIGKVINEVLEK